MIRLLLCDDSGASRSALRSVFRDDPEIEIVGEAANGEEAVSLAVELCPDVVLMDVRMPVLDGIEATSRLRELVPTAGVVALTAYEDPGLVVAMIEAGASAYCVKGAPLGELRHAIETASSARTGHLDQRAVPRVFQEMVRLYHETHARAAQLTDANRELETKTRDLDELTRGIVRALASAVEARDGYTGGHIDRVSRWALVLAERAAPELACDPLVEFGYLLHDVGKLGVPDAILRKPGALEEEEIALMRAHVEIGARLLEPIPGFDSVREIVLSHHERWDGSGYPRGLRGEEIPLAARLFAVCDAYDAMTTDRPYRAALAEARALAELENGAGRQFDPEAVREFVSLVRAGFAISGTTQ